ncbi:MAG: ATP-binding protein [Lentisphaerae bacterium]|jgi:predicted AAA+ superfamily ATPase|nr:ATP-binding protein [Lentisphaerota bacterium]
MLEKLKRILLEFQERPIRQVIRRDDPFPVLEGKATVITGMRRVGKTSFCFQEMLDLLAAGVDKKQLLYLNFEDDRLFGFKLEDCQSILDAYYTLYPDNRSRKCYFFFDEIQNVDNWERFVRRLLDTTNVQVILTGSSSKLLTSEIATAMRGRSVSKELLPFSFAEFLRYKNVFERLPEHLSDDSIAYLRHEMEHYFMLGGFPEIYRYEDIATRIEILQEYSNMVILKDVVERHKVTNTTALRYLLTALYNADSQKFSVTKFWKVLNKGMQVSCSKNDLFAFMDYLEEAYILFRTELHAPSEKAKMVNPDKVYMIDVGLVKAMLEDPMTNKGWLLENLVYLHLRRRKCEVAYYNTVDNKEVDFYVYDKLNRRKILIQVTWSLNDPQTSKREITPLLQAGKELGIDKLYIVTWNEEKMLDGDINVIPIWKFLIDAW